MKLATYQASHLILSFISNSLHTAFGINPTPLRWIPMAAEPVLSVGPALGTGECRCASLVMPNSGVNKELKVKCFAFHRCLPQQTCGIETTCPSERADSPCSRRLFIMLAGEGKLQAWCSCRFTRSSSPSSPSSVERTVWPQFHYIQMDV